MAMDKALTLTDLRGGRNGTDPPLLIPDHQVVEALNVDYADGGLGRKRGGCGWVDITGLTPDPSATILSMVRHMPGADETAAELWLCESGSPTTRFIRMTSGPTFASVTPSPADSVFLPQFVNGASFNGKLFLAYDSAVDRLHVWDGTTLRRVGLATPAAPTAADYGSGTYAATVRYYKVAYVYNPGGTVLRRSEPSAALTFTPSGSGQYALVTKPAALDEGETHWEIYASSDASTYVLIGTKPLTNAITAFADAGGGEVTVTTTNDHGLTTGETVVISGTTSYNGSFTITSTGAKTFKITDTWVANDAAGNVLASTFADGTAPASYAGDAIPVAGTNAVPTSWKYIATNGNRLIGAGAWESGGKNNRVWYTAVLGSSNVGDDERVTNTTDIQNWIDLDENDGGFITGVVGEFMGTTLVFKYRQLWKLVPTGIDTSPFRPVRLSGEIGAVTSQSIVEADDEHGGPCVYFMSHRGPYRYGSAGLEYLGRDIEDIWATANLEFTTYPMCFGVWHPNRHQVWWWARLSASNVRVVFDTQRGRRGEGGVRGGWSQHTGQSCNAGCGVMFAETLTTLTRTFKPYAAHTSAGGGLMRCDTTATTDTVVSTTYDFQAYIETKPYLLGGATRNATLGQAHLLAKSSSGVTITLTNYRDFGLGSSTSSVLLTASDQNETRVFKQFEGCEGNTGGTWAFRVGDSAAASNGWTLEGLVIPYKAQEPR